jgi:hypothetical protein
LAPDKAQVLSCCLHDELSSDLIRLCFENASYRSFADISVFCFYKRDWQTAKVKNIKR